MEKSLKQKMYVSLPMTGIEDNNRSLEIKAFHIARTMGFWVYSPSDLAKYLKQIIENPNYQHYLGYDIWSLSRCDAMLLCPGWESSKGCITEVRFAYENEIPIYDYLTQSLIEPHKLDNGLFPDRITDKDNQQKNYKNLFFWFLALGFSFFIFSGLIHWIQQLF